MPLGHGCANSGLSPSMLAPCGIKPRLLGRGTGSLGQVGQPASDQSLGPKPSPSSASLIGRSRPAKTTGREAFLSDVPSGCPKGMSSMTTDFCRDAQRRADKPVDTPRAPSLVMPGGLAKSFLATLPCEVGSGLLPGTRQASNGTGGGIALRYRATTGRTVGLRVRHTPASERLRAARRPESSGAIGATWAGQRRSRSPNDASRGAG